jgi:hypothetical protein
MSLNWSKIYNNPSFFRNTESKKILKKYLTQKISKDQLSFKLFSIMNPVANKSSLRNSYKNYLKFIEKKIFTKQSISLMDYASGNGFTLLYFQKKYKLKNIFSKDVNKHFINLQKNFLKNCKFEILNPKYFKIREKTNSIDWIICNALFHCLPNKKYAKNLLLEMIRVCKKGVFISDIFNIKYKSNFIKNQMQRQKLTQVEYIKKYKTTPHLYFAKKDFSFLKKNKVNFKFFKMPKNFYDSQFGRFSILIKKNEK